MCAVPIPVNKYVRMGGTPLQRSIFHYWYKPAEIVNFSLLIFSVDHAREIKQLCTLHTVQLKASSLKRVAHCEQSTYHHTPLPSFLRDHPTECISGPTINPFLQHRLLSQEQQGQEKWILMSMFLTVGCTNVQFQGSKIKTTIWTTTHTLEQSMPTSLLICLTGTIFRVTPHDVGP